MRVASWSSADGGADWGVLLGQDAWSVPRLYRWALGTGHVTPQDRSPSTLLSYLLSLGNAAELALLAAAAPGAPESDLDGRPFHVPLEGLRLLPPIAHPPSFRDFYAFEQHVKSARSRRGLEMVPEWYDAPAFYFSNPHALLGHGADVPRPAATREMDFELEIAAVMGLDGRDFTPESGEAAVFGYTVLNDWSARDLQRAEMKVGLGPAKGKDFATSLGPWIVTADEFEHRRAGPGRFDLAMTAKVNGREVSRGNMKDLHFGVGELVARASEGVELFPGDLLGSGTVGTGCILELGPETVPWLQPGDVVELEIEGIGALRNRVV